MSGDREEFRLNADQIRAVISSPQVFGKMLGTQFYPENTGCPENVRDYGMEVRRIRGHDLRQALGEEWAFIVQPWVYGEEARYEPASASPDTLYTLRKDKLDQALEVASQQGWVHAQGTKSRSHTIGR